MKWTGELKNAKCYCSFISTEDSRGVSSETVTHLALCATPLYEAASNTSQMKEMEPGPWGMYLMAELAEPGVKDS